MLRLNIEVCAFRNSHLLEKIQKSLIMSLVVYIYFFISCNENSAKINQITSFR